MSLHIYSNGDSIPVRYERLNDVFFNNNVLLRDTPDIRNIIEKIDKGSYYSDKSFIDRAGGLLPISYLSTGSKTAINILSFPDICFDIVECNYNVIPTILKFKEGCIYFDYPAALLEDDDYSCDIIWKGRHYTSLMNFLQDSRSGDYAE